MSGGVEAVPSDHDLGRANRCDGGSGAFGHAQDLLECLHVTHRVVDGIVVVDGPPEPLPALRVAPVPVESGPEVADAAGGVPERVIQPGPVEHAGYPLPVVGRVVAHEYRARVTEVLAQPGREAPSDFRVGREALADDA